MFSFNEGDKIEKFIKEKDKESLREILSTTNGRWFLMRMLDRCKILSISETLNTNEVIVNEGKRSIAISLLNEINRLGLEGVFLKQAAEKEYAVVMKDIEEKIKEERKNNEI